MKEEKELQMFTIVGLLRISLKGVIQKTMYWIQLKVFTKEHYKFENVICCSILFFYHSRSMTFENQKINIFF